MKVVEKKKPVGETAGETEGARRASVVSPAGVQASETPPPVAAETEVVAKAQRLVEVQKKVAALLGNPFDSEPFLSEAASRTAQLTVESWP